MHRTKHVFFALLGFVLLVGCDRTATGYVILQPTEETSDGNSVSTPPPNAVQLGPGELEEVRALKINLPPGSHISVTTVNGHLTFQPDRRPEHGVTGQSITIRNSTGAMERLPVFITPEAREILIRRRTQR